MNDVMAAVRRALADRYDVERELGGGGMSQVLLARERSLGRSVVIKLLSPALGSELGIARFAREVQIAARLQHPHIVPLLDAGLVDGMPYFTMPYVEGESLRARLSRESPLPFRDAMHILRDVARALDGAHAAGVVHRDIKPENILLSRGVAMVTDFGVSKALEDAAIGANPSIRTTIGMIVGTPAYMAPEQASGETAIDQRADIYAFGVVAYEMLCGRPPFTADSLPALLAAQVLEAPAPMTLSRADIPAALQALVMRCLEKRPEQRPASAAELLTALDALMPLHVAASARQPRRPSRAMVGAVVAATLAVAAWGAFTLFGPKPLVGDGRLMIAPLENLTNDSSLTDLGGVAADVLTNLVLRSSEVGVVAAADVRTMLKEADAADADALRRAARAARANLLLTGTVLLRGDSLVVKGEITDIENGRVVAAFTPVSGPRENPLVAVDSLGDRLLGALGSRRNRAVLFQGSRPASFASQRAFQVGFDLFAIQGKSRDAMVHLREAIALDSTHLLAYTVLARLHINVNEFASADSLQRRAERIPGTPTPVERALLAYLRADLDGDREQMLRMIQEVARYDSSSLTLRRVADAAVVLRQPRVALAALDAIPDSQRGRPGRLSAQSEFRARSEAYHQLGEHSRELREWLRARQIGGFESAVPGQLRAYAGLGNAAAALALADSVLPEPLGFTTSRVIAAADEFAAHGDSATAAELLRRVAARMRGLGRADTTRWRESIAASLALRGIPSGVIPDGDRQLALRPPSLFRLGTDGVIAARRGDRAGALAIADSLTALDASWTFGGREYWRAAILAHLAEPAAAVELLREALARGALSQNWHSVFELAPLRGYPPFEELIRVQR